MIEIRVVENELGMKPEIQYRYHIFTTDASGGLCPPSIYEEWSEWKTAPYVKVEDTSQTGTGALENRCLLSYNDLVKQNSYD